MVVARAAAASRDVYGGQEVASVERSITIEWESICKTQDPVSLENFITRPVLWKRKQLLEAGRAGIFMTLGREQF